MYTGFISIKSVIDRLMASPIFTDLPFERALVWTADVIRLIGSDAYLQRDVIRLGIENYRCMKPLDMVFCKQVRKVNRPYSQESTWSYIDGQIMENPETIGEEYENMYEATDPFHEVYSKSYMEGIAPTRSYKFNGNYIYTSFETGTIDIAYDKILLDQDGFPMIPNDPTIEKAIAAYIKTQYFEMMFEMGKDVSRALDRADREYCWYIGQSQSHAVQMSLDKREALSNAMNRLILNDKPQESFFRNIGYPEKIKKQ